MEMTTIIYEQDVELYGYQVASMVNAIPIDKLTVKDIIWVLDVGVFSHYSFVFLHFVGQLVTSMIKERSKGIIHTGNITNYLEYANIEKVSKLKGVQEDTSVTYNQMNITEGEVLYIVNHRNMKRLAKQYVKSYARIHTEAEKDYLIKNKLTWFGFAYTVYDKYVNMVYKKHKGVKDMEYLPKDLVNILREEYKQHGDEFLIDYFEQHANHKSIIYQKIKE